MRNLLCDGRPGAIASLICVLVLGLVFSGCGSKSYSDGDVRNVTGVYYGTVIDVTDVMVVEDASLVKPLIGAAAGGLLGSAFGAGTGRTLFILGGGALGATLGGAEDALRRKYRATQLTMELDNGRVLVVVQERGEFFVRGDRVRILGMGDERVQVQHE